MRLSSGRGWLLGSLLALGAAGCGGGSSSSSTTSSHTSSTAPAATAGPIRGVLRGQDHAPRVNRLWAYSVRVTDSAGRPLSGTVAIQFVFGAQVVGRDTPPVHPVRAGRWHDRLTFPAAALGMPLMVRAVVHTRQGSLTLNWPIKVVP